MGQTLTNAELFKNCRGGPWITLGLDVQCKLADGILYLQCSQGRKDWLINLDFAVVPYASMRDIFLVHRGFLRAWKSIQDEIRKLSFHTIVGYSYGAGIALLIHEDFWFRNGYQVRTVTFGGPKIFAQMSRECDEERFSAVERIVSEGDFITHLPPFYKHVGKENLLTKHVVRPAGHALFAWYSMHAPEVYRMRLQ